MCGMIGRYRNAGRFSDKDEIIHDDIIFVIDKLTSTTALQRYFENRKVTKSLSHY